MNDAQILTETPTTPAVQDAAKAALDGIDQLKAHAKEALGREFQAIADAAGRGDGQTVSLRLTRHATLDELISGAAWLARDLVDMLLKVATENDPPAVMSSDLATRIREAEIRLQLLREISR